MFYVTYRKPLKGELYEDVVFLLTEDLVKAVDCAKAYAPLGWADPTSWSHHAEWTSVFRCVPEKRDSRDLVYNRQTKKINGKIRGARMTWLEYWGLPSWKLAYEAQLRRSARKVARLEEEFRRIVREQKRSGKFISRPAK